MIFYLWTVKLGLAESTFFESTLGKVLFLINKWADEQKQIAEQMNQMPGANHMPASVPKTAPSIKSVLKGLI